MYETRQKKMYYSICCRSNMSLGVRKPDFCICENKDEDQLCGSRTADQRLCFRYIDSAIPLLSKPSISSLQPSSVAVQPGLCRTWSEIPKTGFLTPRLLSSTWCTEIYQYIKALLTPTLQPVRDLFATDFFATDWRSMRLDQPLYAHIRIEDYNRRLVGDRFATGLRLIGDWLP